MPGNSRHTACALAWQYLAFAVKKLKQVLLFEERALRKGGLSGAAVLDRHSQLKLSSSGLVQQASHMTKCRLTGPGLAT